MSDSGNGHAAQRLQAQSGEPMGSGGITFRAVGIPALAAALVSARSVTSVDAAAASLTSHTWLRHDADDPVALRSGN